MGEISERHALLGMGSEDWMRIGKTKLRGKYISRVMENQTYLKEPKVDLGNQ